MTSKLTCMCIYECDSSFKYVLVLVLVVDTIMLQLAVEAALVQTAICIGYVLASSSHIGWLN